MPCFIVSGIKPVYISVNKTDSSAQSVSPSCNKCSLYTPSLPRAFLVFRLRIVL